MKKLTLLLIFVLPISIFGEYQAKNFYHLVGMPGFSDELLTMHFKLYEGYVKNTNQLISKMNALEENGQARSADYCGLKRMFGFEYDGMRLHELYFENLGGKEALPAKSSLYLQIVKDFGSYENFTTNLKDVGMFRGVGWVILYFDPDANRLFNVWVNEHNVNELVKCEIILAMDVWEHAYLIEYKLDRGQYIDAFIKNINWNLVNNRFDKAKSPSCM
ncbi:MAG: superoxide dismutase [Rhabdochlamydiaceae bacterium]|nr:superoxide dismutase [Candidatus Amphrikana amoebophyrae]